MNKNLVVFNWKMNPPTLKEAKELLNNLLKNKNYKLKTDLVAAPPFIYLETLIEISNASSAIKNYGGLHFASQDVFFQEEGAYTGEISPEMLENLGVEYVIIGHSERRALGETDEVINKKVLESLKHLKVILCVGEPERHFRTEKDGLSDAEDYVKWQLEKDLANIPLSLVSCPGSLIVAYEPVWAIGAEHPDTAEDAVEIIKFIKQFLNSHFFISDPKVLYGGSVDSGNIKDFIKRSEIDGVLVGRASIDKKEFNKILNLL